MISKRWMKAAQSEHSDLPSIMGKLIEEPADFEWRQLGILGEDSEAESEAGPSSFCLRLRTRSNILLYNIRTHITRLVSICPRT